MLLLILAVAWLLYFASWFRARTEDRRSNSIHSFSKSLSVLANTTPVHSTGLSRSSTAAVIPLRPQIPTLGSRVSHTSLTRSQARRRRRDILLGLIGATIVLAIAGTYLGGVVTLLSVVSLLATLAYVALLFRAQRIGAERRDKVRYLPQPARASEPSLLLQRSAN